MAGLFFCLASANGAGLLFCPAAIQPHTSAFTTAFISSMQLYRPRRKTAHGALQKLFRLFAAFFRCCVAVYPAILHHLRHAGAYHSAVAPPANTRYQRHAGRYTGQHSRPIIIRYIRARRLLLRIHARRCSISQTMPARRLVIWHRSAVRANRLAHSTRRGSPAAGARRAAWNHWRLPPQLFSGFRPIANRGQQ